MPTCPSQSLSLIESTSSLHGRGQSTSTMSSFGLATAPRAFIKLKPVLAHLRSKGVRLIAYLDDLLIIGKDKRGRRGISECKEPDGEPGLCNELREATSHRHSQNGVFGFHHQFSLNDIQTSQGKSEGDKGEVQMCSQRTNVNNTRAGPPRRDPGSNTIGGDTSAIALPQSSSTEDRRASPPPLIQVEGIFGATEPDGSGMVGEPPQGSQWKSYSFATSRDDYRIGCLQHRLVGTLEQSKTGSQWSALVFRLHINAKELLAAILSLQTFARDKTGIHVRLKIDDLTAVYYINKMGSTHSRGLMEITAQIWEWSIQRNIVISAEHLPGRLNTTADQESRLKGDSSEWKLDPVVFCQIMEALGPCQVDLFASRLSAQLPRYMSWRPDPGLIATDPSLLRNPFNEPHPLIHQLNLAVWPVVRNSLQGQGISGAASSLILSSWQKATEHIPAIGEDGSDGVPHLHATLFVRL